MQRSNSAKRGLSVHLRQISSDDGNGSFSMHFSPWQQFCGRLSGRWEWVSSSRPKGELGAGAKPFFRLTWRSEGCRSIEPRRSPSELRTGRTPPQRCGKVTNRTSGLFRSVETPPIHLVRCGHETSSEAMALDGRQVANCLATLFIRGNEKERVSATSSEKRGLTARADRSLLGTNRLRLVCERVQLTR